jgi:predicted phage-related endonuclease
VNPLNPATTVHTFATESEWLSLRAADLTSTETAALFGASPYVTEFELYHRKRGSLSSEFSSNSRMTWGTRLEAAIAHGIAEDRGWTIEPLKTYWRIASEGIGSSFDYVITSLPDGPALLEIKSVDGLAYRQNWIMEDEANEPEAPLQIEFQVQHQLLVSGFSRCFIGALVGGNQTVVLERPRNEPVIAEIRKRAALFWGRVNRADAPPAVYPADSDNVRRLHSHAEPGKVLTALGDEHAALHMLVRQYEEAAKREKLAEEDKKVAAALILEKIGDHEKVILPFGSVSAGVVADNPGTEVTAEMVGTFVGGRKGYRGMRFYAKKGK